MPVENGVDFDRLEVASPPVPKVDLGGCESVLHVGPPSLDGEYANPVSLELPGVSALRGHARGLSVQKKLLKVTQELEKSWNSDEDIKRKRS